MTGVDLGSLILYGCIGIMARNEKIFSGMSQMTSAGLEHEVAEGVHTGHDMVFLVTWLLRQRGRKKA